jgi:cellulose synthase operon protein C
MPSRLVALALLLPLAALAEPGDDRAAALSGRLLGESRSARALPDLFRLYELREEVTDLTAFARIFDRVAADRSARADVRAAALELRAQLAVARGQLAQARAIVDRAAPVRTWAVIGPFENDGRTGLRAVYGPEKDGYHRAATYPGKGHEVSWRSLAPQLFPLGYVDLSAAIWPAHDSTVYAATAIRSPGARTAVLHLGASGATRVWVNGKLVREDTAVHPSRWDQGAFPVELRAGDNAVLVKVAHGVGKPGFSLRICDADDEPLPELARSARVPGDDKAALAGVQEAPARRPAAKIPDTLGELREAARLHPEDARAQEDLAIVLAWRRPDDDGERLALHAQERASEAAPGDAEIELRLSRYEDRDGNRRRAALERALARSPDEASVLEALASQRLEHGDAWAAVRFAERARLAAPDQLQPMLTLARADEAVGLTARASLLRLEAGRRHPARAEARTAAAAAQRRLGRGPESEAELRAALAVRFDDAEARGDLTALLLDRGDLDGALRLMGDSIALDPASPYTRMRAAELLSQNGRSAEADRAYAELLDLAPDRPDVHEAAGKHRLRQHDDTAALASFSKALALKPQNPTLRELMRTVRPEEQYAAPYLYDATALAKAPSSAAGDDVEILADLTVTRVFANGLSSRTRQLVLRALNQRGVDQSRWQSVQYSPDRQVVRIERARIVRKDGTVVESRSDGERNVSEPWYAMYYDLRSRVVGFPQLEPGDVIELVHRVDDSGTNFFADYFGDFQYLQGYARKGIADYVLLGPPGRTFYTTATPLPRLSHTQGKLADGGTWQRWTARDVARVVPEPAMPGSSDLLAYVHVSTYKDWESVARFYWGLVKDQLRVTDEVRSAAAEAVQGIAPGDEQARIRAVYDYVVSRTRYVALEFGIHSFKPYPVETVLTRRFGDCKDKASLMHAMLEALGIDSRLVLLRTRRMGNLGAAPASLAVFDHAILYVPKYELYLDGTAEFHGSGELPPDDRGAEALVVEPDGTGSRIRRTPDARPADNVDETRAKLAVRADGSATLDFTASARGPWTAELRRTFESPDERRARAEEQLARAAFPGVRVTAVEVSDPHDIESPFTARFQANAPAFATLSSGRLRFSPFGQQRSYVESYAQLSRRTLPQRLAAPQRLTVSAEIELPRGWSAAVPDDASGEAPQGTWSVKYARDAERITANLALEIAGGVVTPQEYPAFRSFLAKLDRTLLRKVEAFPPAQTAANEGR